VPLLEILCRAISSAADAAPQSLRRRDETSKGAHVQIFCGHLYEMWASHERRLVCERKKEKQAF
jgi:hypothetical protein